jgi:predicted transcriptional regulator
MYNPLVTGITDLSDDELLAKINELNSKMGQASSAGMFSAINQMVVILNEYQEEMTRRHAKSMEEGKEKYDELIDVNKN